MNSAALPGFDAPARVTPYRMEAADIHFLEGQAFDVVVMNGVVENFPGYNYLRRVLNHAVQLLTQEGLVFVGAVRDLDCRNDLRAALQAHALAPAIKPACCGLMPLPSCLFPGSFLWSGGALPCAGGSDVLPLRSGAKPWPERGADLPGERKPAWSAGLPL